MSGTQEFRDLFVAEAAENLQALSDGALKLEKNADDINTVHDLFRAAHTLKGMAATMGYEGLTKVCHALKDCMDTVRSGAQPVSLPLVEVLFAGVDAMTRMVGLVAAGGDGGEADPELVARCRTLVQSGPGQVSAPPPVPAASALAQEPVPAAVIPEAAMVVQAADPNLPADEEGRQAVARAFSDGQPVARVSVKLEPTCAFKGVRGLLVRKALEKQGTVCCTAPAGRHLKEGSFDQGFDVWVASQAPLEDLERSALQVMEVSSATALKVSPPSAQALAAPQSLGPRDMGLLVSAAPMAPAPPEASEAPEDSAAIASRMADAAADAALDAALVRERLAPPKPVAPEPRHEAPEAVVQASGRQTLRVSVERLDKVMNLVGEMVTAKIRLGQIARTYPSKQLGEALLQVEHIVNELQEEVTAARMVPMDQIFSRFPRMIRDLSRDLGKPMELVMEGREIELDRSILDEIGEALVHLLRNAADHGIEPPEDRKRAGKPQIGTVRLEAKRDKNHVLITVEDDGGGIRTEKVRAAAVRKGLLTADAAKAMSEEEAVALIFSPGFSTASKVTSVSGRGVGVDAVRTKVEALGGTLRIENFPGQGTRFRIRLPLTLAIIQALRVRVGREEYMAPVANVIEAVEMGRSDIKRTHGLETVFLRDEVLPVNRLDALLQLPDAPPEAAESFTLLVVEAGDRRAGLLVDEVMGQQEIAIKNLGRTLKGIRGFGGVTILGDGTVCLILDLPTLLEL